MGGLDNETRAGWRGQAVEGTPCGDAGAAVWDGDRPWR